MPKIYLSPSTQEFNMYINGESEEYYMNLLADFLTPYLYSNGIRFKRNEKNMTARDNINESNKDNYDFHLALHSNASPEGEEGLRRGIEIYYFPNSQKGLKMAEILKENLSSIYPLEDSIKLIPTTTLGEVDLTKAPAVLLEVAYHDNLEDALWIQNNLSLIAKEIGRSLAEYFSIPFSLPFAPIKASVSAKSGLNLRDLPTLDSSVLKVIPFSKEVTILGLKDSWARGVYKGTGGFLFKDFLNYI